VRNALLEIELLAQHNAARLDAARRGDSRESAQAFAWAIRSATRFTGDKRKKKKKKGTIALCVSVCSRDGSAMARARALRVVRVVKMNSRTDVFRICVICRLRKKSLDVKELTFVKTFFKGTRSN